jgi:T5orf172 domain.
MNEDKGIERRDFDGIFRSLVVAFQPRGLDRESVRVYYDALQRFSLDVLRDSARLIAETRQFFPTTGEWCQLARELDRRRRTTIDADLEPCEWCAGYGLIRITYRSDEPFDIAICTCLAGVGFRKAGEELVRMRLGIGTEHTIAWLEDFDDIAESGERDVTVVELEAKRGFFVYALKLGDHLKIGFSTNLARRYRDLSSQVGRDGTFIGRAALSNSADARMLERWLQHRFGQWRLDGEWFRAEPQILNDLRALLTSKEALDRELKQARAARQELARRPAQDNFRVIVAVAKQVLNAALPSVPAELLVDRLVERCAELKIAADEDVARRALRAAAWRVQHGQESEPPA